MRNSHHTAARMGRVPPRRGVALAQAAASKTAGLRLIARPIGPSLGRRSFSSARLSNRWAELDRACRSVEAPELELASEQHAVYVVGDDGRD
jgi:hypothetical protein